MSVLTKCMSMYHMCAWCPQRFEEGVGFSRTGVTSSYKPFMWVLEMETGSSGRATVLLTLLAPELQVSLFCLVIFKTGFSV